MGGLSAPFKGKSKIVVREMVAAHNSFNIPALVLLTGLGIQGRVPSSEGTSLAL